MVVGVSVVRCFGFPDDTNFTEQSASTLLEKKLSDILESNSLVSEADGWQKQILHVVARSAQTAATTLTAYESFSHAILADTILVVTITNGSDEAFYGN